MTTTLNPPEGRRFLVRVTVELSSDGRWSAFCADLPGGTMYAETREAAFENVRKAATAFVEDVLEAGASLPTGIVEVPAGETPQEVPDAIVVTVKAPDPPRLRRRDVQLPTHHLGVIGPITRDVIYEERLDRQCGGLAGNPRDADPCSPRSKCPTSWWRDRGDHALGGSRPSTTTTVASSAESLESRCSSRSDRPLQHERSFYYLLPCA